MLRRSEAGRGQMAQISLAHFFPIASFVTLEIRIVQTEWRRGWDSNPRCGFPYARFRGEYFQPLSHLSAVVAIPIVARVLPSSNRALPSKSSAARREKRLKDGRAIYGENTWKHFYPMIEGGIRENFETGTDSPALRIVCAIDEPRNACLDDSAGTHAARF